MIGIWLSSDSAKVCYWSLNLCLRNTLEEGNNIISIQLAKVNSLCVIVNTLADTSQGRNYHRGRGGTCLLDFRQVLGKQTIQNRRTVSVES